MIWNKNKENKDEIGKDAYGVIMQLMETGEQPVTEQLTQIEQDDDTISFITDLELNLWDLLKMMWLKARGNNFHFISSIHFLDDGDVETTGGLMYK